MDLLDDHLVKQATHSYVAWWEERRLRYNVLLVMAFIGIYLGSIRAGDQLDFSYLIPASLLVLFCANVLYSLGSTAQAQLAYYTGGKHDLSHYRGGIYWLGVLFSIVVTLFCALLIIKDMG